MKNWYTIKHGAEYDRGFAGVNSGINKMNTYKKI